MTGEPLGPLHGLPVAIKDVTPTAGIRTTFASPLYQDHVPVEDAEVVRRLKAAGAIVLAKTNTPEFACGAHTDSALFGPARNPWNPDLSPAGSSGGSAVAVATGMVPIAQGTDFGGSVRVPAAFCGIVGLRPTPGLTPSYPMPLAWDPGQLHGPLARDAEDAALMLDAIAGPDDRDRWSLPADTGPSFLAACEGGLEGLSVGWSADFGYARVDPEVAELCGAAAEQFEGMGCHVEVVTPSWENPEEIFRTLSSAESYAAWRERLADSADQLDPSFVSAVERPSGNAKGEYHNLRGLNMTEITGKTDHILDEARARGIVFRQHTIVTFLFQKDLNQPSCVKVVINHEDTSRSVERRPTHETQRG
jgi:Asp-tRNA(Asn)/Glu-tRNA(Gln) amidotransferase A subunit family amidase